MSQQDTANFKVIAFYTAQNDKAHISFVHEANRWFAAQGNQNHFVFDSTSNWDHLKEEFLSRYQVVMFLDTRPESVIQRKVFKQYMENGGAWMGTGIMKSSWDRVNMPAIPGGQQLRC